MNNFDVTKQFQLDMGKELKNLALYCRQNKIPFYMTFCVANNEKHTNYITDTLTPIELGMDLTEDMLRKIALVRNGFDLSMNNIDVFDMDEENK